MRDGFLIIHLLTNSLIDLINTLTFTADVKTCDFKIKAVSISQQIKLPFYKKIQHNNGTKRVILVAKSFKINNRFIKQNHVVLS